MSSRLPTSTVARAGSDTSPKTRAWCPAASTPSVAQKPVSVGATSVMAGRWSGSWCNTRSSKHRGLRGGRLATRVADHRDVAVGQLLTDWRAGAAGGRVYGRPAAGGGARRAEQSADPHLQLSKPPGVGRLGRAADLPPRARVDAGPVWWPGLPMRYWTLRVRVLVWRGAVHACAGTGLRAGAVRSGRGQAPLVVVVASASGWCRVSPRSA